MKKAELKKVLVITDLRPNLERPNARGLGLAHYLPESGWQPIFLTESLEPQTAPPGLSIAETERRIPLGFIRKQLAGKARKSVSGTASPRGTPKMRIMGKVREVVFRTVRSVVAFPDEHRRWIGPAITLGGKVMQREEIQAILSSSSPVSAHIIARRLKDRFGVRWVADLRDLWSQNHNYPYGRVRRWVESILERRTLRHADVVTTVSEPLAAMLSCQLGRHVEVITNGYDPRLVNAAPAAVTRLFTITYTGQIYEKMQDPSKLLKAVRELIDKGELDESDIGIRFFGSPSGMLEAAIKAYGLEDVARQFGPVPGPEAVHRQRESQLLLLLNWEDPLQKGIYTAKLFEYLAARRPIIATGGFGGDVVESLLTDYKAGRYAADSPDIRTAVAHYYAIYKEVGSIPWEGERTRTFEQDMMTARFAEFLDGNS